MNYSEINDDLINNRDFYKEVLKDADKLELPLIITHGAPVPQMNFNRSCSFLIASIFTIKYGMPLDLLMDHLEQIDWKKYLEI